MLKIVKMRVQMATPTQLYMYMCVDGEMQISHPLEFISKGYNDHMHFPKKNSIPAVGTMRSSYVKEKCLKQ